MEKITKEQYLNYLRNGAFDVIVFYEYYNEFNTKPEYSFSLEDFNNIFSHYVQTVGYNNVVNTIRSHYSRKFNVYEVTDKTGKIVGYY
jgi:hypothetical protein